MNCLIIYGQLRTFQKCIPNLLNFIKYDKYKYDVYLCIDTKNDISYNKNNLNILKNMFSEDKIKQIWFVENIIDTEIEDNKVKNYFIKCDKIKEEFQNNHIVTNEFVTRLYNRRIKTLNLVEEYINNNGLVYDKCVFTRFDINLQHYLNKNSFIDILNDEKLYISFDTFFVGKFHKILSIYDFSNNYFSIYQYIKIHGKDNFIKDMNIIEDYDRIIKIWICMPELNFITYLKYNKIDFNDLKFWNLIQR